MKALKLKAPVPTEGDECVALMQWASVTRYKQWRLSNLLIMIPNGAVLAGDVRQRAIQMQRMKRLGFRSGVFDYILPIPVASYPGLFLELKRRDGGVVSGPQALFKFDMEELGWRCAICEGFEAAKSEIEHYLGDANAHSR